MGPRRGGEAHAPAPAQPVAAAPPAVPVPPALAESLRAMEPALPAPAEQLLDPETLAAELELAEVADGVLPHFLREQRPPKSDAQIAASTPRRATRAARRRWPRPKRGPR